MAVSGWTVVGAMYQTGVSCTLDLIQHKTAGCSYRNKPIRSENFILRFGLLQASRREASKRDVRTATAPRPPLLEMCRWKEDYQNEYGSRIWEHPKLSLITDETQQFAIYSCVESTSPQEVLVLAREPQELRCLTRLTARLGSGGYVSSIPGRPLMVVCGLTACFGEASSVRQRDIGELPHAGPNEWAEDDCVHFDIDGAGGEEVVELAVGVDIHRVPRSIKVCLLGNPIFELLILTL
jgi:hypothetical protein